MKMNNLNSCQIKNLKEPEVLYLMKGNIHIGNLYKDYFEYRLPSEYKIEEYYFPAFNPKKKVHTSENILIPFLSRLPKKQRNQYPKFLESYGLNIKDPTKSLRVSDFMLLGYSGAHLPCDPFWLMNPFKNAEPPFEFVLDLNHFDLFIHIFEGWLSKNFQICFTPFKEGKALEVVNPHSEGYILQKVLYSFVEVKNPLNVV